MKKIFVFIISVPIFLVMSCAHNEVKSPASPTQSESTQALTPQLNEQMALYLRLKDPEHYQVNINEKEEPINYDKANINGTTVLMFAAFKGDQTVVKNLLDKNASVNLRDKQWSSELHYAVLGFPKIPIKSGPTKEDLLKQKIEIFKLLISHHADPNLQDNMGITPLRLAVQESPLEVVQLLLDSGANPNIADSDNYTPLHYAANNGKIELIKLLLKYHADPNLKDADDQTPLDIAKENGDIKTIEILNSIQNTITKSRGKRKKF